MANIDRATRKAHIAALHREDQLRQELESALQSAGEAAAAAEQARKAALAEIGALMRLARDAGNLVGPSRAEHLTGLSRQTVADQRDNPQAWQDITHAAEAAHDNEGELEQLYDMYPRLWQIRVDATRLRDQLRDPNKSFNPLDLEEDPQPVQLLLDSHYRQITRLAEGIPTAASDRLVSLHKEVAAQDESGEN